MYATFCEYVILDGMKVTVEGKNTHTAIYASNEKWETEQHQKNFQLEILNRIDRSAV